jgi:hypothetical protein
MLLFSTLAAEETTKNSTTSAIPVDPFEEDEDLRFAADSFCREFTLANPR